MTFRALEHSAIPLYSQVRERLRERINDGTYAPAARLPAESEIGAIFAVSRITVRQALDDLRNEGLIVKVAGKGTFVAGARPSQELARLEGFGEAMARGGHRIVNQVVSHVLLPAAAQVAERLGLEAGAQVSEIRRVRYLDNAPVSFEVTYLPPQVGERLRGEDLAGRDTFLILESDYGITLGHADVQIGAISAGCGALRRSGGDVAAATTTRLTAIEPVGHYAVSLGFDDGHRRGIYPFVLQAGLAAPTGMDAALA
ncbi:UTRA domain-containing protein [Pseudoduganella buxea]|uniref:Transcriptional regulator n=1 Tax=Pseudoduganella buxea TaxID=1949069 RepID=A0A6I3SZC7_9BURK|nr:UTRA domain-containing protein [Pseudoduganella buxea]MTV54449.1 UTRA domain-containing protein [Pseudoduganella buxea]GGC05369.1 transcriptional regulator [Pseudoduganella buxea]